MKNSHIKISNHKKEMISPNKIRVICDIESDYLPKKLWFEIEKENITSEDCSPQLNWAILALLIPASIQGKSIYVDGTVSKRLTYNLNTDFQAFLESFEPKFKKINISAKKLSDEVFEKKNNFIGTGFSAGIDSFTTMIEHSAYSKSPYEVTHTCIFNVGAFARHFKKGVRDFFESSSKRCRQYAIRNNFQSIIIDSNIDEFYPRSQAFALSHTVRNISCSMLFEGYLSGYLYSSGYAPSIILDLRPSHDIALLDPIIIPMLATENFKIISTGSSMSRFEKIDLVSQSIEAQNILDCCAATLKQRVEKKFKNCNRCKKCARTMISLESLGQLNNFGKVFDLNYYQIHKSHLHADLKARAFFGNARDIEVVNESQKRGYIVKGSFFYIFKFLINNRVIRAMKLSAIFTYRLVKRKKNVYA